MNAFLLRTGQLVGLLGMVLMALSVVARLTGRFALGDFPDRHTLAGERRCRYRRLLPAALVDC